ncbi:GNAT family N-acetyltransferase [Gilliamella apicola]|uniref:GNAT family N-acetyltransferase n=1 Tax=Gilliamella apicola TaxID=1196095 RepID=A0A556RGG8_9GAMM|nr:GNAT family N-acetyltransferase [Gilliamella apicola]TSJ87988.1 GNAT family N-acetyltransferase [Gilliamella apicola]
MIKEATLFDLPSVFEISKELYSKAVNHQNIYKWDDASAIHSLKILITSDNSTILIDEQNKKLNGFIIANISTPPAGKNLIASDIAFFVRPEAQGGTTALRLIKRYETWAKSKGATHIELGVSSGVNTERTLSMYSFLGYSPSSVTYIKEL